MYDIFYVSKNIGNKDDWIKIKSKYPTAQKIDNVKDYNQIKSRAFTKMFWVIWDDLTLNESFDLSEYRATTWDDMYVHIFKNSEHYDGICLFPKKLEISKREFDNRFFTEKKEIDIVASSPKPYDIFYINTYEEYLESIESSTTEMFWVVWNDLIVNKDFKFDYRVPYFDVFHKNIIHVFKNNNHYDGICLFPSNIKISKREFDYRFFTEKKEVDIVASTPRPYDIVFISYNEPNAEDNYEKLLKKFPRVKRVDKVQGIHQAHIEAAKITDTEMFWVVDGDAIVLDSFNFNYEVATYEKDVVHVWRSQNPINGLIYGYGGVKLLPRKLTLDMNTDTPDMTTAISKKFKAMPDISNITAFNTDPFNTWKSAFRECVKLSSKIIDRQCNDETEQRLNTWCSKGQDNPFGEFAIKGAVAGRQYGYDNKDAKEKLKLINDFSWLEQQFKKIL